MFTFFALSLAAFYIAGRLKLEVYERAIQSLVVAGTLGSAVFVFCFFDLIPATRFVTGAERAGFVKLVSWLSVALPVDALIESSFVPHLLHRVDLTWFLRWPVEFVVAGLLGIVAAISKKRWGWAIWGTVPLLWGILWFRGMFSE